MGALRWCEIVADVCVAKGVPTYVGIERLRKGEYYLLAKRQFDMDASDRVVIPKREARSGLLARALAEIVGTGTEIETEMETGE